MGLMDIVEFVEKVCEFSLTDFQKEFVRGKIEESIRVYGIWNCRSL